MALFRRGAGSTEAVYARMVDGEHLWLAVRGAGPLVLRRDGADDLELPTEPQADAEGPLLTTRFPLARALAGVEDAELELRLLAGSGRGAGAVAHAAPTPAGPGLPEPPTRDGRWRFRVVPVDGEVVVRRSRLAPTVAVLGFTADEAGVGIRLATDATAATLVSEGRQLADLPVESGTLRVGDLPSLPAGTTATFVVDGAEAVRSGNALERPMAGVALPPLPEPDVSLRWTREAVLAVRREERAG